MADPDDRRDSARGRRGGDQALDILADRIDAAEGRFERGLQKLEVEIDRLEEVVDRRVGELEEFHIREQERANTRTAKAVTRARTISSIGAAGGALGVAVAVLEHFVHL